MFCEYRGDVGGWGTVGWRKFLQVFTKAQTVLAYDADIGLHNTRYNLIRLSDPTVVITLKVTKKNTDPAFVTDKAVDTTVS